MIPMVNNKTIHSLIIILGIIFIIVLLAARYYLLVAENGLIIKIKPLAIVLTHGAYTDGIMDNYLYDAHAMSYKKEIRLTVNIIDELVDEGYNYIYLTACESRNKNYISKLTNDSSTNIIYWDDYKRQGIHIYRSMLFGGIGNLSL